MDDLIYDYLDYLHMEIGLKPEDIAMVPLSGSADAACSEIADKQYVIDQLAEVPDAKLFKAVRSLCDEPELNTRKDAIEYIVWMVACNIKDGGDWSEEYDDDECHIALMPDNTTNVTMLNP